MEAGEACRLGHRPALDGLRGVAILLVIACHVTAFLTPNVALYGAGLGVDVFFVLSGFLITSLLLEEHADTGRIRLGRFYARRARRLLPAALTLLAIWSALCLAVGVSTTRVAQSALVVLTYSTNYYKSSERDVVEGIGHFWTLAVEEQFYLAAPLVLLFVLRRWVSTRAISFGAATGALLIFAWRTVLLLDRPVVDVAMRTDARCDGLLVGVAMAAGWKAGILRPERLARFGFPALGALLVLALGVPAWALDGVWFSATVAVAVMLAAVVTAALLTAGLSERLLSAAWLRYTGRLSYSLYLWHVPAIMAAGLLVGPVVAHVVAAVVFSFALAELSYRLVERPALKLGGAEVVRGEIGPRDVVARS